MKELGIDEKATLPMLLVVNFVVKGARTERLSGSSMDYEKMSSFLQAYALAMKQLKVRVCGCSFVSSLIGVV